MRGGITAILLAAGCSLRMGRDKLLLPFRGETLLARALALLLALPVEERILVSTPERIASLRVPPGVTVIENRSPAAGQSGSLRAGVAAAKGEDYLFLAADQPLLDPAALDPLLKRAGESKIVYPLVEGQPTLPAMFSARFRAELLAQEGDIGGRAVRAAHPAHCLGLPVEAPWPFWDIDTEEDYQRLLQMEDGAL